MAGKNTDDFDDDYDENGTIADLRLLVREIKKYWLMGDNQIITEARGALLDVMFKSEKRLQKKYKE